MTACYDALLQIYIVLGYITRSGNMCNQILQHLKHMRHMGLSD